MKVILFMKNNISVYFIALITAVMISSCHSVSPESMITINDTEKTLYINKGKLINITLTSNPTTGYSWETEPYDESLMKFVRSTYSPNSDRIGSNGQRIIEFKALNSGRIVLELFYMRVWEKNKKPIKKFKITIVIE